MEKQYPGKMTDENISHIFRDAADFVRRELRCGEHTLYAYAIDGLIASAYASDYIFKPITQHLSAPTMQELYDRALTGMIYNNVANPCKDLDSIAFLLVNGFCVVLFPEVGAIGFEVRTPDKRGTGAPEVENTVKGAKDAFVETMRINTSLVRRRICSPKLKLVESTVGRKSHTRVAIMFVDGIASPDTVEELARRLKGMRCHVNLIPLNAVKERNLEAPTKQDVAAFLKRLELKNVSATVRREMGADIDGACGQLRRKYLEK